MSFGKNLQLLRKMRNSMTQEALAEKIGVSRQTISKWELDMVYPEMDKVLELCSLFSCSMDQLIREDMTACSEAYSDIRIEQTDPFQYIRYTVVSTEPEEDALEHVRRWASTLGIASPAIIGWDFPTVSQEQINVFNMHGYTAALILPPDIILSAPKAEVIRQDTQKYIAITIRQPFSAPFRLIPNAYKALITYMHANGISDCRNPEVISCFEKQYELHGVDYMDVYIAIE